MASSDEILHLSLVWPHQINNQVNNDITSKQNTMDSFLMRTDTSVKISHAEKSGHEDEEQQAP